MSTPLMKPVRIGTINVIPATFKNIPHPNYPDKPTMTVRAIDIPRATIWNDTGKVGILYEFLTEGDSEGMETVGLVELPDGQFETYAASCLMLVNPTTL